MESQPDETLLAAQARLLETRKLLYGDAPESESTNSSETEKYVAQLTCLRCQKTLPINRMALCDDCDEKVRAEQKLRKGRDEIAATEMRLKRSALPVCYASGERRLGNLPLSAARMMDACNSIGNGIAGACLCGPSKSFKTSVAASFLASQIRGGARGLFVSVLDLMTDITASYARGKSAFGDTRASLIYECVDTPLLVLDDFGKEKASEHSAGVIFEILDGRFRRQSKERWLIVTTQFSYDDLVARFERDCPPETIEAIEHRLSQLTTLVRSV